MKAVKAMKILQRQPVTLCRVLTMAALYAAITALIWFRPELVALTQNLLHL